MSFLSFDAVSSQPESIGSPLTVVTLGCRSVKNVDQYDIKIPVKKNRIFKKNTRGMSIVFIPFMYQPLALFCQTST